MINYYDEWCSLKSKSQNFAARYLEQVVEENIQYILDEYQDGEDLSDFVWELVDGLQEVIYTWRSTCIVEGAEDSEIDDINDERGDGSGTVGQLAFMVIYNRTMQDARISKLE